MRTATRFACFVCLSWLALPALAANLTPEGTWKQVDDDTGKVTSIIRIDIENGMLTGTVVNVMNMSPEAIARDGNPPICTQCDGERHNQPIEGMQIMWGLHKDGDQWTDGHILDPSNGKTYDVKLNLIDHGQKLKVRGYVGFSLFGRTQIWQRVKAQPEPKPRAKNPIMVLLPTAPQSTVPANAGSAAGSHMQTPAESRSTGDADTDGK